MSRGGPTTRRSHEGWSWRKRTDEEEEEEGMEERRNEGILLRDVKRRATPTQLMAESGRHTVLIWKV